MTFRRLRRKMRCVLKHGPRGCPHIERHTRRRKRRRRPQVVVSPPPLPAALTEQRPITGGRHVLPLG